MQLLKIYLRGGNVMYHWSDKLIVWIVWGIICAFICGGNYFQGFAAWIVGSPLIISGLKK